MVPAVTDISYRQRSQSQRFRRIDQASAPAHRGHTQPPGQRSAARYSAQASSLLKRLSSSSKVRGKSSSMTPKSTYWGWWRQVNTPNPVMIKLLNNFTVTRTVLYLVFTLPHELSALVLEQEATG